MKLFAKKCEYCKIKITKGKEIKKEVKVPGYLGTYPKHFCCDEHVDKYEKVVKERIKNTKVCRTCV